MRDKVMTTSKNNEIMIITCIRINPFNYNIFLLRCNGMTCRIERINYRSLVLFFCSIYLEMYEWITEDSLYSSMHTRLDDRNFSLNKKMRRWVIKTLSTWKVLRSLLRYFWLYILGCVAWQVKQSLMFFLYHGLIFL
jgi:hypothetical protein